MPEAGCGKSNSLDPRHTAKSVNDILGLNLGRANDSETSARSLMCDCAATLPDTNQTPRSQGSPNRTVAARPVGLTRSIHAISQCPASRPDTRPSIVACESALKWDVA